MKIFLVLIFVSSLLGSCATICGGSKYNASILVNGRPNAEIYYQGGVIGNGSASIKVKRSQANKLSLTIKERGCQDQNFNYTSRVFRGWALVGTLVTWTGTYDFIPYGLIVDLATGALWKPDAAEKGVTKHNYKNYQYIINYTGCESKPKSEDTGVAQIQDKLVDVVYLKNGSRIRGTLIDQDPAKFVKIQTADGSIFVFKIEEIEKVTRE
jgi:hypothetical protein